MTSTWWLYYLFSLQKRYWQTHRRKERGPEATCNDIPAFHERRDTGCFSTAAIFWPFWSLCKSKFEDSSLCWCCESVLYPWPSVNMSRTSMVHWRPSMPGITARLNDQGMKEFHFAETEKSLFCFFSKGAGDFPLLILQASTLESSLSFLKRAQHIYFIAFY